MVATPGPASETDVIIPVAGRERRRGRAMVSALGSRVRRPVLRRHDLRLRAARQRPRPDPQEAGTERSYGSITEFLATQLFGTWDVVLRHDLSQGLRIAAGPDAERLRRMVATPERADRRAEVLAARPRRRSSRSWTS